jgi:hypothetical protein
MFADELFVGEGEEDGGEAVSAVGPGSEWREKGGRTQAFKAEGGSGVRVHLGSP